MDYAASSFPEPQPPPPPQHVVSHHPYPVPPPQAQHLSLHQPPPPQSSYPSFYPSPNPSFPNPSYHSPIPAPAPVDPYTPHGGYSVGPAASGAAAGGGVTGYYYERVAAESRGFEVKEAIRQYGVDPFGYPLVPPMPSNGLGPSAPTYVVPRQPRAKPKKASKTTKVVQSAYCGVCKIDCTTQEVLNIHKQGKKHKKNLQKLQEAITPRPKKTQAKTFEKKAAPVVDKRDVGSSKQRKRKEAQGADLETKKMRILEGGAEPNQVMVCTICNVVVNRKTVYDSHITGSKHAAMVKKQQEAVAS